MNSNIYHMKCLDLNKHMTDTFSAMKSLQAISGTYSTWVFSGKKNGILMKSVRAGWVSDLSVCSVENGRREEVFA